MKRSTVSIFALAGALALGGFACDDDDDNGNTDAAVKFDGSAGSGVGGAGGAVRLDGGAGSTAGAGGGTVGDGGAGTGGARQDGGGDAPGDGGGGNNNRDGGGDGGTPLAFITCTGPQTMVAATPEDFCNYFDSVCSDFYGGGQNRFSNRAECITRYTAFTAGQKQCTTYHLCVAGTSDMNAMDHCPHPSGAGGNPCGVP